MLYFSKKELKKYQKWNDEIKKIMYTDIKVIVVSIKIEYEGRCVWITGRIF